jgi:soluble lytic murein transglycosylase-like protein
MKATEIGASIRRIGRTLRRAMHSGLAGFGLIALLVLVLDAGYLWPITDQSGTAIAGVAVSIAETGEEREIATLPPDPKQRGVATYLARKYRVALDATERLVVNAFAAATEIGVDPLLILAVMAVESSLNPIAESGYGARGLMQVVPRFHLEKVASYGGADALLEPDVNIRVGAEILKEYIRRTGSLEGGLQLYAGAADDPERGYARKVLTEMQRLKDAAARPPQRGAAV